jgi:O-antigen ligase
VLASLVAAAAASGIAYETLPTGETRFRGVFSEPAGLGIAAGLLLGTAWYSVEQPPLKWLAVSVAAAALALTASRTALVAVGAAAIVTSLLYGRRRRPLLALGALWALIVVVLTAGIFEFRLGQDLLARVVRTDSLSTFTGRTALWQEGLAIAAERPLFGYGLTMGSVALTGDVPRNDTGLQLTAAPTIRETAAATLHSGYLQALVDSGVLGFALYLCVIVGAIVTLWRKDRARLHAAPMFALVFFAVANIAENVIQTASVTHSALFWMLASMTLGMAESQPSAAADPPGVTRPSNLMR